MSVKHGSGDIVLTFDTAALEEFKRNLADTQGKVLVGGYNGIEDLSNVVEMRAFAGCPVYTGYLRSSLYSDIDMSDDSVEGVVGHGGAYNKLNIYSGRWTDDYAVEVHEGGHIRGDNLKMGATWKWLEFALNSINPQFLGVMSAYISASLAGDITGEEMTAAIRDVYHQAAQQVIDRREARRARKAQRMGGVSSGKSTRGSW